MPLFILFSASYSFAGPNNSSPVSPSASITLWDTGENAGEVIRVMGVGRYVEAAALLWGPCGTCAVSRVRALSMWAEKRRVFTLLLRRYVQRAPAASIQNYNDGTGIL